MYKAFATEIIARGKEAEDKAWRAKQNKLLEERGWEPSKAYGVLGRELGRVFAEGPEFETWQEAQQWGSEYAADEEIQALERERAEKGIVVEGSQEFFILTDY